MRRLPKKKIKLFVEGDTEENYFSHLKKGNEVEITYEEVNMHGGGYTNFLKKLKKFGELGYIAVFIIVDMDKIDEDKASFNKLKEFCDNKNKAKKIPYFLVGTNKDFEFFACSHCPNYKGQPTDRYITNEWGYKSVDEFKSDTKIYEFLNKNNRSYQIALEKLSRKNPYISNAFVVKKQDMKISITKTKINEEALSYQHSNIQELFAIIGINIA